MTLAELAADLERRLAALEAFWLTTTEQQRRDRFVVMQNCKHPVRFKARDGKWTEPSLVDLPRATLMPHSGAIRMARQLRDGNDESNAKAIHLGACYECVKQQLTEIHTTVSSHLAKMEQTHV
jgi:hypothetical protein